MIEVRLRHEEEADAQRLGEWENDQLDKVIPLLERWGVYVRGEEAMGFSGQFIADESGAYFEVVVLVEQD